MAHSPAHDEEPWRRREDETDPAFEAFQLYLVGGPGYSLAALCTDHFTPGKLRTVEGWSSKFDWQRRRAAWQDNLARKRLRKQQEKLEAVEDKLYERLPDILEAAINKAVQTGDPRATKDLLDRAGLTRKKADSANSVSGKIEFNFSSASDEKLLELLNALDT